MIRNVFKICPVLIALFPLHALAEKAVSESAPMAANGTLDVNSVAGEVSIVGWNRDEVEVKGELGYTQQLDFSSDGDHTRVEVRSERESHGDEEEEADLVIRVPATARVRATTVAARLTVTGLTNELQLQTVSGDIEAQVYAADVTIGTISGTIQVDGREGGGGSMRLNLISGDAWIRDISGDLAVRTVSGDLNIRAGKLRRTRVDTTSGDVNMRASLEPDARFEVDSTSGDLRLELCGKPEAEYELSSFSGEISAFDRQGEQRNEHGPTSELRFKLGSGKALVRIESLSGEISLDDC